MGMLGRFAAIGIIAVGVVVCWSQPAHAAASALFGYVSCRAESAAPHFYYSAWQEVRSLFGHETWWVLPDDTGRRLREQSLEHLAMEFASHVAEHHDAEHLLFPHCELKTDSFPTVEGAGYARGGAFVPYDDSEMTAVDWWPDFSASFWRNAGGGAPGRLFVDCVGCPVMTVVPGGEFRMGSPASEPGRRESEGPRRTVVIEKPFAVGVHEVTFNQWQMCLDAGACRGYYPDDRGWGRDRRPVIHVAWEDARAYVKWLSSETGEEYRLLSEAEWEYVARAGTTASRYWGDDVTLQCDFGNGADFDSDPYRSEYDEDREDEGVARCNDGAFGTAVVGSYLPNAFGLYDVLGNVWELTADCWHETHADAPLDGRIRTGGDCDRHVLRGGGHYSFPTALRAARRTAARTSFDFDRNSGPRDSFDRGFRVARVIE